MVSSKLPETAAEDSCDCPEIDVSDADIVFSGATFSVFAPSAATAVGATGDAGSCAAVAGFAGTGSNLTGRNGVIGAVALSITLTAGAVTLLTAPATGAVTLSAVSATGAVTESMGGTVTLTSVLVRESVKDDAAAGTAFTTQGESTEHSEANAAGVPIRDIAPVNGIRTRLWDILLIFMIPPNLNNDSYLC